MLIHTPTHLAQYYRDQRKVLGLSQTAVAQETFMRQDTVSKFEISPDNVRLDTVFRLLAALDLELHVVPKSSPDSETEERKWTESW